MIPFPISPTIPTITDEAIIISFKKTAFSGGLFEAAMEEDDAFASAILTVDM